MKIQIPIKMFAIAQQLAGSPNITIELDEPGTVGQLRTKLVAQVPAFAPIAAHLLFAVDSEYADDATLVAETSEVACIPPVSGG